MTNVDRARKLFHRWIELFPEQSKAWIQFAEMEF